MKNWHIVLGMTLSLIVGGILGTYHESNRDIAIVGDCAESSVEVLVPGFEITEEKGEWQEIFNEGNKAIVEAENGTMYFYEYDGEVWQPQFSMDKSKVVVPDP